MLKDKYILVGLSGGIACYKTAELIRLLKKAQAQVQVVMTQAATQFITPLTLQALSGRPVLTDQWATVTHLQRKSSTRRQTPNDDTEIEFDDGMSHIHQSRIADAILLAPASANTLAKLATGICDDLLTTLCLARTCPLLVAPAMNQQMWAHPATQRNLQQLQADGVEILGPDAGEQACGEVGLGRMLAPEHLLSALEDFFVSKCLSGKHVLITAGPTYEPIDPVRGLTNLSSGKMGFALARAAHAAGAKVTLIAGPCCQATPYGVARIDVMTAVQMHDAVQAQLDSVDILIAAAAVADWRVQEVSTSKLKKQAAQQTPYWPLQLNPDILASVAARAKPPYCVGFAAESENLEAYAQAKRVAKNVPLIVANHGPSTFGQDDNQILLCDAQGTTQLPRMSKQALAQQLILEIARRIDK